MNEFLKLSHHFITSLKPRVLSSITEEVICVLGNESADLDSIVSAIAYGYYKTKSSKKIYAPLIDIPRQDLALRTEVTYLFKKLGIETKYLIFSDEVDLQALSSQNKLSLILIDHNRLALHFSSLGNSVKGIIDHHRNENLYENVDFRIIETVGSCSTLIFEEIKKDKELNAQMFEDEQFSKLLLGPIIIDTVNLEEKHGRVTPKDQQAATDLLSYLSKSVDWKNEYFNSINQAKFDISSLSSFDLLRKDYKKWTLGNLKKIELGMSSITMSIQEWITKDKSFLEALETYSEKESLDILICMTVSNEPVFQRGLLVFFPKEPRYDLIKFLETSPLQLEKLDSLNGERWMCYEQKDITFSRKKLQPMLMDYFAQVEIKQ